MIDAYLGEFADQLTDEQKADLERTFRAIDERYPLDEDGQDDWAEEREAACTAAAQLAFGDATLESIVADWREALAAERRAMAALTGALNAAVLHEQETELARRLNLNRMTVRKALGK